jgi:hypothetical protein
VLRWLLEGRKGQEWWGRKGEEGKEKPCFCRPTRREIFYPN